MRREGEKERGPKHMDGVSSQKKKQNENENEKGKEGDLYVIKETKRWNSARGEIDEEEGKAVSDVMHVKSAWTSWREGKL